ncbi:hypothetical protein [Anaerosolibacter sp.]|jgi:uncharacterized integral membrane protein|uniref:hypothetical protein n=1 Tax=Anaerosolibacter sp. TaxID=1872527 RepID=UPI00261D1A96|nr:hypothetical protein [Anaerosolibacter sp.]MDF2547974.1 hypothetical protein [Anaerosolibacter sp.]
MRFNKEYIQKSRLIVFIVLGLLLILENIDSVTLPWVFKPLIVMLMGIMVILIQLEKKAN